MLCLALSISVAFRLACHSRFGWSELAHKFCQSMSTVCLCSNFEVCLLFDSLALLWRCVMLRNSGSSNSSTPSERAREIVVGFLALPDWQCNAVLLLLSLAASLSSIAMAKTADDSTSTTTTTTVRGCQHVNIELSLSLSRITNHVVRTVELAYLPRRLLKPDHAKRAPKYPCPPDISYYRGLIRAGENLSPILQICTDSSLAQVQLRAI